MSKRDRIHHTAADSRRQAFLALAKYFVDDGKPLELLRELAEYGPKSTHEVRNEHSPTWLQNRDLIVYLRDSGKPLVAITPWGELVVDEVSHLMGAVNTHLSEIMRRAL